MMDGKSVLCDFLLARDCSASNIDVTERVMTMLFSSAASRRMVRSQALSSRESAAHQFGQRLPPDFRLRENFRERVGSMCVFVRAWQCSVSTHLLGTETF